MWGVEEVRKKLTLPRWAATDVEEERRLAAMKILLQDDFKSMSAKAVADLAIANPSQPGQRMGGATSTIKVVDAFPDVYSDFRLLRFLRKDKVQDPVTAALRYRQFLEWREEYGIDALRLMIEDRPFAPPQHLALVNEHLPSDFQATPATVEGIVRVFLHVGDWDTDTITKLIQSNELSLRSFLQYWAYTFDSLHYHLHQESMRQRQMVFIEEVCDLSGMSLKQFSPAFLSTVLKPWIDMTQKNYPETAKRIMFKNPPRIMSLVWRLVTPMVSPGTVAKIRIGDEK